MIDDVSCDSKHFVVHVVDDDPESRGAIAAAIGSMESPIRFHLAAASFLAEYDRREPACAIINLNMAGNSGLQLLKQLASEADLLPVVALTGSDEGSVDVDEIVAAVRAGAISVLPKPIDGRRLLDALVGVRREAEERAQFRRRCAEVEVLQSGLTPREREVMDRMIDGASTKELARDLGISPKTAHVHRSAILRKMGIVNQVELLQLRPFLRP